MSNLTTSNRLVSAANDVVVIRSAGGAPGALQARALDLIWRVGYALNVEPGYVLGFDFSQLGKTLEDAANAKALDDVLLLSERERLRDAARVLTGTSEMPADQRLMAAREVSLMIGRLMAVVARRHANTAAGWRDAVAARRARQPTAPPAVKREVERIERQAKITPGTSVTLPVTPPATPPVTPRTFGPIVRKKAAPPAPVPPPPVLGPRPSAEELEAAADALLAVGKGREPRLTAEIEEAEAPAAGSEPEQARARAEGYIDQVLKRGSAPGARYVRRLDQLERGELREVVLALEPWANEETARSLERQLDRGVETSKLEEAVVRELEAIRSLKRGAAGLGAIPSALEVGRPGASHVGRTSGHTFIGWGWTR